MRITKTTSSEVPARPSKYTDLIAKATSLRYGQNLEITVPKGTTIDPFRVCVRQALNRYVSKEVKAKKAFVVRKLSNGKVGILSLRVVE